MASGYNRPRKLDYVQFTRVDNSASISLTADSTTTANGDSAGISSKSILTKVAMIPPKVAVTVISATIIFAVIVPVIVALIVILAAGDTRAQIRNVTENQTSVSTRETASTETPTSSSVWIFPTIASSNSTSSLMLFTTTKSPSSSCADDQFRCPNGQCVPSSFVCNEFYDCLDKGDEANCPDCTGFRCVSNNVCLWDRMTRKCNQVFDCPDYSDELNCSSYLGTHLCHNGVRIISNNVCDGLDDCGDNSDEELCVCKRRQQFSCSKQQRGKCIPSTWRCDGHPDCPNGTDEEDCGVCAEGNFRCADYTCVNMSLRCDGKVDCVFAGGDEDDCVELTPLSELHVMVNNTMLPVCSDGWTNEHSTWVCSTLHTREVMFWKREPYPSHVAKFAAIKDPQTETGIVNFRMSDACQSEAIIHLKCQDAGCGQRKVDVLESFVAGGNIATLGKWPWVISLAYLDKPICGGVLISAGWALTAAHCVMNLEGSKNDYSKTPFSFTVTAGTVDISGSITDSKLHQPQAVRVSKIILHPKNIVLDSGGVDWDIALLQLESDITMSDFVQPVCLPSEAQVFLPSARCYLAGWGLLSYRQYIRSSKLRDTKMQVWSERRCSDNIIIGEHTVNTNSTLCAGYVFGRPTACQGDSGGPLTCRDPISGSYVLAGIVSRGSDQCGEARPNIHSNRFARVAMAVTWIQETMGG